MSTSLARQTWWGAALDLVARLWPGASEVEVGAGSADTPVQSSYDTMASMSAMSRFPWVRACVHALAGDLSGLPLVAIRERAGQRDRIPSHPVLDQLARPGSGMTGRLLRKQLVVDFALTGNAYVWRPGAGTLSPLVRLHPGLIVANANRYGVITSYTYTVEGVVSELDPDEVLHIRDVSWEDSVTQLLGEGAIRSLHDSLLAEMYASEQTAKSARRGRIEMLFSAKDDKAALGDKQVDKVTAKYEQATRAGKGAFFVGMPFEATPLSLTPREMEYSQLRELNMYAVLAVFGVPPVRVGLPSANYGTSKQQMRNYWEGLRQLSAFFDDAFSTLADNVVTRIEHDLSGVEALQVSYTERQVRVQRWIEMGASPIDAARYEGFVDAPLTDQRPEGMGSAPGNQQPRTEEPQDKALADALERYLGQAGERYQLAGNGGSVPESMADVERVRLEEVLGGWGLADEADEIAGINHEAVRQALAKTGAAVLAGSPIFSRERAARLASRLTAEAA